MAKQKLSPKQAEFCRQYVVDHNATQAAIRAGYAEAGARVRGHRLLTNSNILERIDQLHKTAEVRTNITVDSVLERLDEVANRCMAEKLDSSGAARALELIGKHLGMFREKIDHDHRGSITLQWDEGGDRDPDDA